MLGTSDIGKRRPRVDLPLKKIREKLGGKGVSDEDLLLRFIMKGEKEIQAMRAMGPPRQYFHASLPLVTLIQELNKHARVRYIHIEQGADSLVIQHRSSSSQ